MVLHKHGERLYSRLKQLVTDHLIKKVQYLLSAFEKQGCCCFFFSAELVEMARNEFLQHGIISAVALSCGRQMAFSL